MHGHFLCLAIANQKYKNYNNFYHFLFLLLRDVSLNHCKRCKSNPLNKKGMHFLHININRLLPKTDELKCMVNKTKAAIIWITESYCT